MLWLSCLAAPAGLAGCKDGPASAEASREVTAASTELSAEEEALLKRRDALLNSRRSLLEKRQALDEERRRVIATGGDTTEVDKKVDELAKQEKQLGDAEIEFNRDLDRIFAQMQEIRVQVTSAVGDDKAKMAARETLVAGREKGLAVREKRLAVREESLAKREAQLAERERNTCGAGATTIVQAPAPKGTKYSKRDVESALKNARRQMSRKGILPSDLPPAAQGLEKEATKAMSNGDYGHARFAAAQLAATIKAIKIDKAFIQGKIGRLSRQMKGVKLSGKTRKDVDEQFRRATASYGDGRFKSANSRLNKIYSVIGKRG